MEKTFFIYDNQLLKWKDGDQDYVLRIRRDDFAQSPRTDREACLGRMICWHRNYTLGDTHTYDCPQSFWQSMVRKLVSEKEIFTAAAEGKLNGIRLQKRGGSNSYDIYETAYMAGLQTSDEASDEIAYRDVEESFVTSYIMDDLTVSHCQNLLDPHMVWLPLWLYDHSGITMSCGKRAYPFTDRWDSGQVGWIYMTKEKAYGELLIKAYDDWKEQAEKALHNEVKTYDAYLRGDIYMYTLYTIDKDGKMEQWDQCGDFSGDDILTNGMAEMFEENHYGFKAALAANGVITGEVKTETVVRETFVF